MTLMYVHVLTVVLVKPGDRLQRCRRGVHAATRLNDPHPKGTEFQYMSLSCCMHSDASPGTSESSRQNQFSSVRTIPDVLCEGTGIRLGRTRSSTAVHVLLVHCVHGASIRPSALSALESVPRFYRLNTN